MILITECKNSLPWYWELYGQIKFDVTVDTNTCKLAGECAKCIYIFVYVLLHTVLLVFHGSN